MILLRTSKVDTLHVLCRQFQYILRQYVNTVNATAGTRRSYMKPASGHAAGHSRGKFEHVQCVRREAARLTLRRDVSALGQLLAAGRLDTYTYMRRSVLRRYICKTSIRWVDAMDPATLGLPSHYRPKHPKIKTQDCVDLSNKRERACVTSPRELFLDWTVDHVSDTTDVWFESRGTAELTDRRHNSKMETMPGTLICCGYPKILRAKPAFLAHIQSPSVRCEYAV